MNSRTVLVIVAVVGAIALFGVGSSFYADTNTVDPNGASRLERIENLQHQMDHLHEVHGVPSECVDKLTAGGLTCIETCLPHQYMLGTELRPPSATDPMVCEVVFCACADGRREDF